jgi:hypothetical protein
VNVPAMTWDATLASDSQAWVSIALLLVFCADRYFSTRRMLVSLRILPSSKATQARCDVVSRVLLLTGIIFSGPGFLAALGRLPHHNVQVSSSAVSSAMLISSSCAATGYPSVLPSRVATVAWLRRRRARTLKGSVFCRSPFS